MLPLFVKCKAIMTCSSHTSLTGMWRTLTIEATGTISECEGCLRVMILDSSNKQFALFNDLIDRQQFHPLRWKEYIVPCALNPVKLSHLEM